MKVEALLQIKGQSMAQTDLSKKIEQLDILEERVGVSLHGLSAFLESQGADHIMLMVRGEMQTRDGTQLKHDIELNIAVYDSTGRVIGTGNGMYYADNFFALDTFEVVIFLPVNDVGRIRVYPKKNE